MGKRNGTISEDDKRTRPVMIRIPVPVASMIDDFAGNTHTFRPDFIVDAIRQYYPYFLRLSAQLVQEMEPLQASDEAKRKYFGQRMAELISNEFTLYRKAMESTNRRDDVNVLVSMPVGLLEMLDPILELGVFRNNQEFYKVSLFYLMDVYREMEIQIDTISGFTGTPRVRSSLDEEVESIRRELEGDKN
jgi:hypothetical protein